MLKNLKIKGFTHYIISDEGVMHNTIGHRKGAFIGSLDDEGYRVTTLTDEAGRRRCFYIQDLVYFTYNTTTIEHNGLIELDDYAALLEEYEVDHINDVRSDNRKANLQLITQAENAKKKHRKEAIANYNKNERIHNDEDYGTAVIAEKDGIVVYADSQGELARILDLNRKAVNNVLRGLAKTTKGWSIRYA